MAVEVVSHALLDNHLHTILRIRPDLAQKWSDREIAQRWLTICPGKREQDSARPPTTPTKEQIKAH